MVTFVNRAKQTTATTGTGNITLGSAVDGFQTFAAAGITNLQSVRYAIEDGSNFEIGTGVYTASGTSLSRSVEESSNSNNAINLSGSADVYITIASADFDAKIEAVVNDTSPSLGGNLASNGSDVLFGDTDKAVFGTGSDLQIYHDGTNSQITNAGGYLDLSNTTVGSSIRILGSGESLAEFTDDGDVDLFHNGSLRLSTTAAGANIAGDLTVTGTVDGIDVASRDAVLSTTKTTADSALQKSGSVTATGNLAMGANKITGVADPTAAQDVASKTYVDSIAAAGVSYHTPVRLVSTGNISAAYLNGSSGVGATLTNNSTQTALALDGIAVIASDRVLIDEQTNQAHNGAYTVTNIGSGSTNWVLTRATDADTYENVGSTGLGQGSAFFISEGTIEAGHLKVCNTAGVITFNTTAITFTLAADTTIYSAGSGLTLTGTAFAHGDTSSVGDLNNSGNTFIQDITFDTFGHVSSVTAATTSIPDINNGTITIAAGAALTGGADFTTNQSANETITLAHGDTSSVADINGSGNSFIQDISFDTYGHVTAVTAATTSLPTVNDATITISAGSALTGGAAFTTNQSGNETVTLNHGDTSTQASVNNTTATVIQDVTLDTYGHVTSLGSHTLTLANLGYTGATNANYITNNNQLTNGAGYSTTGGTVTSVATGSGLSGGTITGSGTLTHADTSSVGNVDNSGNTFLQDITFDTFGHVASISSGTVSIGNATISIAAGSGLTGGAAFTTNQTSAETITLNHADTSSQGSVNNSGAAVIQDVSLDTYGHVTSLVSHTMTLANLGYTGATNANYITNNNQLTNGAGYTNNTVANAALPKAGGTMTGNTLVNNYGIGLVGLYSASRYQNVFAMGDSYKLSADGTSAGSLYGIAWTHTNVGGQSKSGLSHQALFMFNGVTQSAIGYGIWTSGVITTTNNIVVSGTVDGRDVSTDGTKLDGIQASANYITNNNQLTNGAGYTTNVGDITGVTAGTNMSGGGTSGAVTLSTSMTPTFTEVYAGGWLRNNNSNTGIYNQATGQHFYSDHDDWWNVAGGTTANGIRFRDEHAGTIRGSVYATNSNQIGFLDKDAQWCIRHTDGGSTDFLSNNVLKMTINSSGNLTTYGVSITIGNSTSSDIYMNDTDHGQRRIHCNSNNIGFLNTSNAWAAYCPDAGGWSVVGNLAVTGTTDGRDVSADGTKLDTIATSANYITNNNQLTNGAGYTTNTGDITGVTAGTNLSGGGTSGTPTLNVISNPTFTGQLSAHGDISLGNNIGSKLYTGKANLYADGTATYLTQSSTTTHPVYIESADVRLRVRNSGNNGYKDLVTSTTGQDCQLHANGFVKLLTRDDGVTITGSCSTTTGFLAASDINLKENIETIYDPLEKLKQLNGYTFDWKETGKKSAGVIAQEVEKVMPELVHGDDTKSVDYNGLIGLLIETVKAQQVQIDDLNKRIEA